MESDSSSPTSPEQRRSRQASRCSSTTMGSSATSASFDLPDELGPQDPTDDAIEIAGIDKAFDDLDVGKHSEHDPVDDDVKQTKKSAETESKPVDMAEGDEEGSDETLREAGQDTVQEEDNGDEVDEEHPVYQYTLALFEYTKRQYLEARWQHEKLERDQHRRGTKQSGMQRMAARKAAMSSKHEHGI